MSEQPAQQTVQDTIDKGLGMVQTFADKLSEMMNQHGPQAWELARATARVSAADYLLTSWLGMGVLGVSAWLSIKFGTLMWKWAIAKADELVAVIATAAVVGITCGVAFGGLHANGAVSAWPYVGIAYPEIWIAHRLLNI